MVDISPPPMHAYGVLERSFHSSPSLRAHRALTRRQTEPNLIFPAAAPIKPPLSSFLDDSSSQNSGAARSPLSSPGLPLSPQSGLPPTPPSNVSDDTDDPSFSPPPFADGVVSNLLSTKPSVSTPVNQRSPPTPEPSPPRVTTTTTTTTTTTDAIARQPPRPTVLQYPSSRAESFKTAKEEQLSSNGEDGPVQFEDFSSPAFINPPLPFQPSPPISSPPSPSPSPPSSSDRREDTAETISMTTATTAAARSDDDVTPTNMHPQNQNSQNVSTGKQDQPHAADPDGRAADMSPIPDREWDTNLMRNVTVRRKRRPKTSPPPQLHLETHEPEQSIRQARPRLRQSSLPPLLRAPSVDSTTSKKSGVQREMSLRRRHNHIQRSPQSVRHKETQPDEPLSWEQEVSKRLSSHLSEIESKRLSMTSNSSTVVEAMVVVTPVKKRQPLRHARRNLALRTDVESSSGELSSSPSSPTKLSPSSSLQSSPSRRSRSYRSNRDSIHSEDMPLHRLNHKKATIKSRRDVHSFGSDLSASLVSSSASPAPSKQRRQSITVMIIPQAEKPLPPLEAIAQGSGVQVHPLTRDNLAKHTGPYRPHPAYFDSPPYSSPKSRRMSFEQRRASSPPVFRLASHGLASASRPSVESPTPSTKQYRRLRRSTPLPDSPARTEDREDHSTIPSRRSSTSTTASKRERRVLLDSPFPAVNEPATPTTSERELNRHSVARSFGPERPSLLKDRLSVSASTVDNLRSPSITGSSSLLLHPDYEPRRMSAVDQFAEEHAMARHIFAQTTPFSQFSDNGEMLEVSEATAVSIFPHNNHSLLVVQQVSRSNSKARSVSLGSAATRPTQPTLMVEPSTPPQRSMSEFAVDSPLKNPRKPPAPPVIHFIPPTPAKELDRQLQAPAQTSGGEPVRRMSLRQRARRYSDTYIAPLLSRNPSLSRRATTTRYSPRNPPTVSERDGKLHPFWRPRGFWDDFESSEEESLDGRLPEGGDTSDVEPVEKMTLKRRLTNRVKGTSGGGFLIGNSVGIERHGSNNRRHHVSLPRSSSQRHAEVAVSRQQPPVIPRYRVEKRSSTASLHSTQAYHSSPRRSASLNGEVPSRRFSRSETQRLKRSYRIPGLGMQVEYVGLRGVTSRIREKRAEKRRERLRASIGTKFLVEGTNVV